MDIRALATDSCPYRRRAKDTLAGWTEVTTFQQDTNIPADLHVHTAGYTDDTPSGTILKT